MTDTAKDAANGTEHTKRTGRSGRAAVGHPVDVATGKLFDDFEDYTISGQMPLNFGRHYSSDLVGNEQGMFGPGWASNFEARLTRDLDGFRLIDIDGETEILFDDPKVTVDTGGVVRNLGSYAEITREDKQLVVTRWNVDADDITRYRFAIPEFGQWTCLESVTDFPGQGYDIKRDEHGRVVRISQRREPRGFLLDYGTNGRIAEVREYYPHVFDHPTTGKPRVKEQSHVVLRYAYSEAGRLIGMTNVLDHRCGYEYDDDGYMIRETNICGMVYRFTYDDQRRCVQTTGERRYGLQALEFDPSGKVVWVTNAEDETSTYVCNERGQIEKEIDPLGNEKTTEYDEHGRIVALINAVGSRTEYAYGEHGDRVKLVDPTGAVTAYAFNDVHQVIAITDPANHVWRREYDDSGKVVRVLNPLGDALRYAYNDAGDLREVVDPGDHKTTFDWNSIGDLSTVADPLGNVTGYEYTKQGQLKTVIDAKGFRTRARLDKLGRVKEVILADGAKRRFQWNAYGQIMEYVDELGERTTWKYQACGIPKVITRPHGGKIRFHWSNVPGRLLNVSNERREDYKFEYDRAGRLVKETDFADRKTKYRLDAAGQVVTTTDAAQRSTTITRDDLGRVAKIAYADGNETVFDYDARGLMTFADNGQVPVTRQYDEVGRLICEKQGDHEVKSFYDAEGNRVRRESTQGVPTEFSWNGNHQLTRLCRAGSKPMHFEYDERQVEIARYVQNGVRISQKFDARGRRIEQKVLGTRCNAPGTTAVGEDVVVKRNYAYDAASNLVQLMDKNWGIAKHTYDSVGRIQSTDFLGEFSERFEYDLTDNIQSSFRQTLQETKQNALEESETWEYGKGNTLCKRGKINYEFNSIGQLVKKTAPDKGNTRFQWNDAGQLVKAILPSGDEWEYHYDALSRRTTKAGPERCENFTWDGDVILHEQRRRDGGEVQLTQWEYEPKGFAPIGKIEHNRAYYCVNDMAGNPRELLADKGHIEWAARFSTWGHELDSRERTVDCPVRYLGQWHDDETGLENNRYRYYDPDTGRYISSDPIRLFGGVNQYAIAPNIFGWTDPYGLNKKRRRRQCDGSDDSHNKLEHEYNVKKPITVDDALGIAGEFMVDGVPITKTEVTNSGVQFIQIFTENDQIITMRAGFDLNPKSPHVIKHGPHLNLHIRINKTDASKKGFPDPHIAIDPITIRHPNAKSLGDY